MAAAVAEVRPDYPAQQVAYCEGAAAPIHAC